MIENWVASIESLRNTGLCHSGQTLTPIELYIGIKPLNRHLRPFGSILYVVTSRPLRDKLDPKAKKGTLKPQQSNSGASSGLKFSVYEVVENGDDDDDKTLNNIPVSLPQNSDSETEEEELSRSNSSVVPVKTTWKRVVVPQPDGSRNDIFFYELGKSERLRFAMKLKNIARIEI
ncbi:hypothetical protein TNCV_547421 [Trichonephila clavipes]|nr:hypothetical protein TNCV_547421 [Trichonephila clavipes]